MSIAINKRLFVLTNADTNEVICASFDKEEVDKKFDELKESSTVLNYGYYDRV